MEVFHKDSNQMTGHVWEPVADPSARQEVFVSFRGRKGAFSRNRKKVTASSPVEQRDAAWENIATWKFTSKIGLLRTFLGAKMRSVFFWHFCKLFLMSTKYTFLAKNDLRSTWKSREFPEMTLNWARPVSAGRGRPVFCPSELIWLLLKQLVAKSEKYWAALWPFCG